MSKQPIRRLTSLPLKKPRSRKAMIDFLTNHFRYDTGRSWNALSSYAVKIKISNLKLTNEETNRCYEALEAESCYDESGFSDITRQFDEDHDHRWQIGTNGRSGGYAVLYTGHKEDSGYKSRCAACGQKNYTEATPTNNKCGVCNRATRLNLSSPIYSIKTTMAGVDMEQDYEDWDIATIRSRVNLVWEFDQAVEDACHSFLDWAMTHKVVDEEIKVSKTIKVAVPR